jgi:hypothetical protein
MFHRLVIDVAEEDAQMALEDHQAMALVNVDARDQMMKRICRFVLVQGEEQCLYRIWKVMWRRVRRNQRHRRTKIMMVSLLIVQKQVLQT